MSIIADHINYTYEIGTGFERQAIKDISFAIEDGEFIGLIGHTGSGKSTLIQHLNGLVKATSGTVYYNGQDIYDKDYDLKTLRSKVGLVFQYPEHQLFETDIFKDVCFGPKNLGLPKMEVELRAYILMMPSMAPLLMFFGISESCAMAGSAVRYRMARSYSTMPL